MGSILASTYCVVFSRIWKLLKFNDKLKAHVIDTRFLQSRWIWNRIDGATVMKPQRLGLIGCFETYISTNSLRVHNHSARKLSETKAWLPSECMRAIVIVAGRRVFDACVSIMFFFWVNSTFCTIVPLLVPPPPPLGSCESPPEAPLNDQANETMKGY